MTDDSRGGPSGQRGRTRRRLVAIILHRQATARSRDTRPQHGSHRGIEERAVADRLYPTDHRKVQATTVAPPAAITGGAREDGRDVPTSDRTAHRSTTLHEQPESFHIG
jgi:hypothetical protein